MVGSCAAFGCKNRWTRDRKRQFHRFPLNDPVRLKKWLIAVRRASWQPSKSSMLCGDHFTEDSYKSRAKYFLKDDAVPSIFSFSSESQKKTGTARNTKPIIEYAVPAKRICQDTESSNDIPEPSTSTFSNKTVIDKNDNFSLDVSNTLSMVYSNVNPVVSSPVASSCINPTQAYCVKEVGTEEKSTKKELLIKVVYNPVVSGPIIYSASVSDPLASNCINPTQTDCIKKDVTEEKPTKKELQIKVHNLQKKLLRREKRIKYLESLLACTTKVADMPDETESLS